MYDQEKYINTLELQSVLHLLANEATLQSAKELALRVRPFASCDEVIRELKKTEDAFLLTAKYASPSFGSPIDPSSLLTRAEVGGVLNMGELLDVADCLRTVRTLKEWRENFAVNTVTAIDYLFENLLPNKYLEDKIRFAIKSEDEMNDNASEKLAQIRLKIRSASTGIKDRLDHIVKNQNRAKFLQDAIVTQRDGRFVVPVKAEFKSEIPGIVHDTSSSGATLFVEPMAVVEANNEIRVLKAQEKEEIDRILYELSVETASFSGAIKASFSAAVELNLIFAKASLAYKMKATVPAVNTAGRTVLKNARHPLIPADRVVPISLTLGNGYNTLVITGPNTGGKTVTLKTVGLLTVMAMCGLMIPAGDGSETAFFDRILVDIGDEQSIEQSLSTFSSHMVNIVNILEESDKNALVLLDELGGGTDPVEGAALAKAILVHLSMNGARIVATTHYAELKSYALETSGVENACCEFDVDTLKPTYRLLIGVPGKSNAFAISEKLGVGRDVVSLAKSYISNEDQQFERVIDALERTRKEAELEREQARKLREELSHATEKARMALEEAESKQAKLLEKAKSDACYIIDNARYKSNQLLSELEDVKKQFNAQNAAELLSKAKQLSKSAVKEMEETADPVRARSEENYQLPRELVAGDRVNVFDINEKAVVEQLSKDKKKALVAIGSLKTWTPVSNLRLDTAPKKEKSTKPRTVSGVTSRAERDVRYEFDMRGMTIDEGIMELDRYLDNAVLSGIPSVTVIHGKGTGALRKAVHEYLRSNKFVKTFRLGVFGEGESGVTIVEFKN